MEKFQKMLEKYFEPRQAKDRRKIMPLGEAIKKYVRPEMKIHFAVTHSRANASLNELARQFWGQDPRFEFISVGLTGTQCMLVHGGLLKRAHASFFGDSYPTPGPNPILSNAYQKKLVDFRHWSIHSLPLALSAAAQGLPFLPTRSLVGSTMAIDNEETGDLKIINDPFGSDQQLAAVKAMAPDISFVHAHAADADGNLLMTPPFGPDVWGPFAAREGVIATVEKIVSSDFLARHSWLVRVPGYLVRSISVVQMGAHPAGMSSVGATEVESYADDYEFIKTAREAYQKPDTFDDWLDEWILGVGSHEDYLKKLGSERTLFLKGKSRSDSWRFELREWEGLIDQARAPTPAELMIVAASKKIEQIVKRRAYRTLLAGVGASNLASWLAGMRLWQEDYPLDIMAEIGFYGYSPRPADPFIFNYRNLPTAKALTSLNSILGLKVGGSKNMCLGAIGAGQVDRFGNINSTCIPGIMLMVGSGGGNDVASTASEVVAVAVQDRLRFIDTLPYITSPGKNINTLVSTMGVFEKGSGDELILTEYFEEEGEDEETTIRKIKENTGWDLKITEHVRPIAAPKPEELLLLRMCDPHGSFTQK